MIAEELALIISKHAAWLSIDSGGCRANLAGANLAGANLAGANLRLSDLSVANLYGANLRGANLAETGLSRTDLSGANLAETDLSGANMRGANMRGADLSVANLEWSDLSVANLYGANLRGANMRGANLVGANLVGANLRGAKLPHFQICPREGSFTAYKKVKGGVVLRLQIPHDARRTSSLTGRKCRAEFVYVMEALPPAKGPCFESRHGGVYIVGHRTHADKYDPDIRVECSHGIHFFMTREEAEQW